MAKKAPKKLKLGEGVYEIGYDSDGNVTYLAKRGRNEEYTQAIPGFFTLRVSEDSTILFET